MAVDGSTLARLAVENSGEQGSADIYEVADGLGFLEELVDLTAINVAQEEDPPHEVVASFFEVFALTSRGS
jgi:hypothetical protein